MSKHIYKAEILTIKFVPPEPEDEATQQLRSLGLPVESDEDLSEEEAYKKMYQAIFTPINVVLSHVTAFKESLNAVEDPRIDDPCTDIFLGYKFVTIKGHVDEFEKIMKDFYNDSE